jgi:hypothetical protein
MDRSTIAASQPGLQAECESGPDSEWSALGQALTTPQNELDADEIRLRAIFVSGAFRELAGHNEHPVFLEFTKRFGRLIIDFHAAICRPGVERSLWQKVFDGRGRRKSLPSPDLNIL